MGRGGSAYVDTHIVLVQLPMGCTDGRCAAVFYDWDLPTL
jgi:hypothetical protein